MLRSKRLYIVGTVILIILTSNSFSSLLWKCDPSNEACTRTYNNTDDLLYPSIEMCRLVCGKYGGLWPKPTISTELSQQLFTFSPRSVHFELPTANASIVTFLKTASNLFLSSVISNGDTSNCKENENSLEISFNVLSSTTVLNWNTDESYSLQVTSNGTAHYVKITATTIFGARHALETLSQLIEVWPNNDQPSCLMMVQHAQISDRPVYRHRGLLLDTARNFLSIASIKKHIEAMAYSKMNVLHWHITDSQSFPLEVPSLPNMTRYGAYSPDQVYRIDEINELFSFAKQRGVMIIIEIDAPSHSGNGWQWGAEAGLGNLAVCVNQEPWRLYCIQPPCGQLNPINPNLYKTLNLLYGDLVNKLPKSDVFHMGGDEVFIPCWNSTYEIIQYLNKKPRTIDTFLDLWSDFQNKALSEYDSVVGDSHTSIIVWSSHLTEIEVIQKYLSKDRYVIQTWVPSQDLLPQKLLELGYKLIVSTKDAWYLDHGFWGVTTYYNWRQVYNNKIPQADGTLGGEVCMWGEYVDDSATQPRVWPRAAAAAERLWSNPNTGSTEAEGRFYRHRERLVARGINADAVIPRWCYQNDKKC